MGGLKKMYMYVCTYLEKRVVLLGDFNSIYIHVSPPIFI